MKGKNYALVFFLIAFALVLFLFFKTVQVFLIPIFLAFVFALVLHPVFRWFKAKLKNKDVAASITIILFIIILVIPTLFSIGVIANEAYKSFDRISGSLESGSMCDSESQVCSVIMDITEKIDFESMAKTASNFIFERGTSIVKGIANTVTMLVIMVFCMYFFIRDGKQLEEYIESLVPMEKKYRHRISQKFKDVCYATIYGNLVVALVQGIAGGIGFAIFGLPSPFLWGGMMAIFALFPVGGTSIIWIPAGVIAILNQNYFAGIGILIWGACIVGLLDNLLKPKLIGGKTELHTLLIFISVIGGLATFGFVGILLGPILAVLLVIFLDIYRNRFVNRK